jgi:hypothetical protein
MINTVDDVIAELGGPGATAALVGLGTSAVRNWSARGKIAPDKFLIIKAALGALGKDVDPSVFGFKTVEVSAS